MCNIWEKLRQKIEIATKDRLRLQFAKKIGVQPNTVKAWVESQTVPGIDKLESIAEALGLSLDEIFGPQTKTLTAREPGITITKKDPLLARLLAAWGRLDDVDRETLLRMIERLANPELEDKPSDTPTKPKKTSA